MMALFYGLLPKLVTIGIPVFLHAYLDLFVGAIQTYVFLYSLVWYLLMINCQKQRKMIGDFIMITMKV